MDKPRILFLGSYNSTISQLAEALMRKRVGNDFDIYSAGIFPHEIDPAVIKVLKETGCDVTALYSKPFYVLISQIAFSVIITVRPEVDQYIPALPGSSMLLQWFFNNLPQPPVSPAYKIKYYRKLRDDIDCKVIQLVKDLGHTLVLPG